ncbi:AI-2E family transporter [Paraflavisolibacter sp. H34]|uniref:AI-2E family transporter n=1 Tax=Huijunlia imazamoxiresistens TaxID=3127457 RepID=UPI0030164970
MTNNTIDSNLLRQIFFILLILFLGVILFRELRFFFPAFLGSVTFYVIMRNRMFYLAEVRGWKRPAAAWILMLLSFFVILVPIGLLANILYSRISYIVLHSTELVVSLRKAATNVRERLGVEIIKPEDIQDLGLYLSQLLPRILDITFNTVTLIVAMYFILYFMLVNGRRMENILYEYIPLDNTNVDRIGDEITRIVRASAIGIPLIALIQGIVGLVGYLVIGVSDPFLWFIATCLTSMIPLVGASLVYVPLTVMLLVQGEIGKGIAMAVWGFGLIGLVDNLFRFILNRRLGQIHPMITAFGVIAGIQLFGFIGLIFGPLLISMFILLLRIYFSEFLVKKREPKRLP